MPHFLVIARDHPQKPERRLGARAEHLEWAKEQKEVGRLIHAGALLGEDGGMVGSVLLFQVESGEALAALLAEDPYAKQNVFESVDITPYKPAPIFQG
ncbi:MAG: YciI family protein [Pseudomonadota bacterium]